MEEDCAISPLLDVRDTCASLLHAIWEPVYLRCAVCFLSLCLPASLSVLNCAPASLNTTPPPRDVFIPAVSLSR